MELRKTTNNKSRKKLIGLSAGIILLGTMALTGCGKSEPTNDIKELPTPVPIEQEHTQDDTEFNDGAAEDIPITVTPEDSAEDIDSAQTPTNDNNYEYKGFDEVMLSAGQKDLQSYLKQTPYDWEADAPAQLYKATVGDYLITAGVSGEGSDIVIIGVTLLGETYDDGTTDIIAHKSASGLSADVGSLIDQAFAEIKQ